MKQIKPWTCRWNWMTGRWDFISFIFPVLPPFALGMPSIDLSFDPDKTDK